MFEHFAQGLPESGVRVMIWCLERAGLENYMSPTLQDASKIDASPHPLAHTFVPPNSQTWHWSRKLLILIKFPAIKALNLIFSLHFMSQILCFLSPKCLHTCHFLTIVTVRIQKHITFLWDSMGSAQTTFPPTSNIPRKVLLQPSFPLNWWSCVMLGTHQNHLGWVVGASVGGAGGGVYANNLTEPFTQPTVEIP